MIDSIVQLLNTTRIFVIITFIVSLLFLNLKSDQNKLLLSILSVSFITESIAVILICIDSSEHIGLLYSLSVLFHNSLWLLLLVTSISSSESLKYIVVGFILFAIYNLYFLEGPVKFNYLSFIAGALMYIIVFIYQSFAQLKQENFPLFQSNTYILLFAPILFFFGMSFMFGFRSSTITSIIVFDNVKLYTFINEFVNIIYYLSIIFYIYKEKKKIKHEQ